MYRSTTPLHTFTLPFETSRLSKALITYSQNGEIVLEKTEADCTLDGCDIAIRLTQEETLLFTTQNDTRVNIQLKVKTTDGLVYASNIVKKFANDCLNNEVMT